MTKLWAVAVRLISGCTYSTQLRFQSVETKSEAEKLTKKDLEEGLCKESAYTLMEMETRLVLFNPPPPIPDWLSKLKKGDTVYSDYKSGDDLEPF